MHDDWSKYQFFQHALIQKALENDPTDKERKVLLKSLAESLNNIGIFYYNGGDVEKGLSYYEQSIKIQETLGDTKGIAVSLNNLGVVYETVGDNKKALEYYQKSLALQNKLGDKKAIAANLYNIGHTYYHQGKTAEGIKHFQKALALEEELGFKNGIARSLNNLGGVYDDQGDIEKALSYYFKSLKITEEIGEKKGVTQSLNNIGAIYYQLGQLKASRSYFDKSLKIQEESNDQGGIAKSLSNIGNIHLKKKEVDKALEYFFRALKIRENISQKKEIANSLNTIGGAYRFQNKYEEALKYYLKCLEIVVQTNDKEGLSISHINIGTLYYELNNLPLAKKYATKGLDVSQELGFPTRIRDAALLLSDIYEKESNGMKAFEMYQLYITMHDSVNNKETAKTTARQQAKYEYEKQKTIDDAEHDKLLAIEHEEKEKQIIITGATGAGLGLVVVFLIFVFNRLRITKKQKLVIETQKKEVENQKEIVEKAHEALEEKNQEITDSITYAKRIQSAILPPDKLVKENLKESFILYKPKDIVAGDFYWLEQKNNKVLFAAADCTGHGVPGAMVSVVCNNALNRSVREHKLTDPGEILNKTREIVIAEFEKSDEEVKDGMDIAICSLEGNKLLYAGANNPLWIIRKGELIETKANKQPIGQFDHPEPYTTHSFELQKGDSIYIFSDGYVDQFGGEKGKKFKAKAFRELLLTIQNQPMEEQKTIIDNSFEAWRGGLEQIDDVCVIGVSV